MAIISCTWSIFLLMIFVFQDLFRKSSCSVTCDFEDDFCGWTQRDGGSYEDEFICGIHGKTCEKTAVYYIKWHREKNSKPISEIYMKDRTVLRTYNEFSYWAAGLTLLADLTSSEFPVLPSERCLSFSFRVKGNATLKVFYTSDRFVKNGVEEIKSYERNEKLTRSSVNLPIGKEFRVMFRAIFLDTCTGEVIIDDISSSNGTCIDTCPMHQYQCDDKHCIDLHQVCDSIPDCPDGSDEHDCGSTMERENQFKECVMDTALTETRCIQNTNKQDQSSNSKICVDTGLKIPCALKYYESINNTRSANLSNNKNITTNCTEKQDSCFLTCPNHCTCTGVSFKCSKLQIPLLARSIDLSGVTFSTLEINIYRFSYLIALKISNCGLTTLSWLKFPPKLQHLDVSYNRINNLDFDLHQRLVSLILDYNPLENLLFNQKGSTITYIGYLRAVNTYINTVDFHIEKSTRSYIDLSFNNLTTIPDSLSRFSHALTLNISYNNIVYRSIVNFHVIDMRYNKVDDFVVNSETRILFLQYNKLYKFVVPNFYDGEGTSTFQLRYLNLEHNEIVELEKWFVGKFRALTYLILADNKIQDLEETTFYDLNILIYLDMSKNYLFSLKPRSFVGLKSLRYLNLHRNSLTTIGNGVFSHLLELLILDLSKNKIQSIAEGSFKGLSKLQRLILDHNEFLVFEHMFEGLSTLTYLQVSSYTICCAKPVTVASDMCISPVDDISSCDQLIDVPILGICIWYMSFLAIFGNFVVVIYRARFMSKRQSRTQSILITNLSCSDFLMGIYLYIIAIVDLVFKRKYGLNDYDWRNGKLCTFAGILATTSSEASAILLLLITVDRVIAIKNSISGRRLSVRMAKVLSSLAWIFSVSMAVMPLLHDEYFQSFYSRSGICISLPLSAIRKAGWEYSIAIFVVFNLIIFMGILIGQVLIFLEVKSVGKGLHNSHHRQREIALAKNLFLLVITDMMCWIPICVIGLLSIFGITVSSKVYAWTVVVILPLNSSLNPVLYTLSVVLREYVKKSEMESRVRSMISSEMEELKRKCSLLDDKDKQIEILNRNIKELEENFNRSQLKENSKEKYAIE